MKNMFIKSEIMVGSIGGINLSLPLLEFGNGKKSVLIISNQHGGELSGMFIIKYLIDVLRDFEILEKIKIIPTVNPLGLLLNLRNEPISNDDLNRNFPGSPNGNLVSRIADKIFKMALKNEFVIDIHSFHRDSPIVGILPITNDSTEKKSRILLKHLNPNIIWEMNTQSKSDLKYINSLNFVLAKNNIPCIGVECPDFHYLEKKQIDTVIEGILKMLIIKKIIKSKNSTLKANVNNIIPIYKIKTVSIEQAGLFIPKFSYGQKIKKNNIIGTIFNINSGNSIEVLSKYSGIIISIKRYDFVLPGMKIYSIGVKNGNL